MRQKYKGSGQLSFCSFRLGRTATLLDYVRGGLQLDVHIAVDYSAGNGNQLLPSSLHCAQAIRIFYFLNC